MELFQSQNKRKKPPIPYFPNVHSLLTCALMSAAIKGGPLIRSIHERMFYAKGAYLGDSLFWSRYILRMDLNYTTPSTGRQKFESEKCHADPNQCKLHI